MEISIEYYEAKLAIISHLRELARKTHAAISGIGLSTPKDRIQALGGLVQMITYGSPFNNTAPPTTVLYQTRGDCSEKSDLMAGILLNDPWNLMPAYIDCEIDGIRHFTIGIDEPDLDNPSALNSTFTVATTDIQVWKGYPDTEYIFFEMTIDRPLGKRGNGVEGPYKIYDTGDYGHRTKTVADDSPNY